MKKFTWGKFKFILICNGDSSLLYQEGAGLADHVGTEKECLEYVFNNYSSKGDK